MSESLESMCARQWAPHIANGQATLKRRELRRNTFPPVRVEHPTYGERIVRAQSNLDAVFAYAAELGINWTLVLDAKVWRIEESNQGGKTPHESTSYEILRALFPEVAGSVQGNASEQKDGEGDLHGVRTPKILLRLPHRAEGGDHMSAATEKLKKELGTVTAGDRKVQAMKEPIYTALCSFCEQDEEFEQAVLQGGTLSDCLAYVAKGVGNSISDLEAYKKAVQFYFRGATVEMTLTVNVEGDVVKKTTQKPTKSVLLDITDFL